MCNCRVGAVDQHGEFVASEARGHIDGTDFPPDALGKRDEDLVADGVAKGVVDALEPVDVQQEEEAAAVYSIEDRLMDLTEQSDPAQQPGETVATNLHREELGLV